MSDPLIDPSDLGTYLNDPKIDTERATFLIDQAQALCETVVSPLPDAGAVVVTRVAGRAYVTVSSPRQAQLAAAGSPYGGTPSIGGGVYLTRYDKADLRRLQGGGGAFSIDILPADYTAPVPWWGDGSDTESITDFDQIP